MATDPVRRESEPARRALALAATAQLILTSVHHVHGALAFDTPWRLHILYLAVPVLAVIWALLRLPEGRGRRRARAAALVALLFPAAMIGVYEGGYNHVLKNLIYFAAGETAARHLFPAPLHEMPTDLPFELTGIAQFFLGLWVGKAALRLLSGREP